jgi:LacI family transcriptional regulator
MRSFLKTGCMPRVAVIVSYVEQEYCRSMVRGITRYANSNGSWEWEVFLARNPEIKRINAREFDGVIFDTANPATLGKWKRSKLPCVQVFSSREPFSVNYDEQRIGALAAEHLHGTGKRLVALGSPAESKPAWLGKRITGFCNWAREHNLPVETFRLGGGIPHPSTPFGKWKPVPRIAQWIKSLNKPCAIFCADIHLAREVMAVCRTLKIDIPAEIAVMGVDNDEILCLMERPTLSAVITQSEKVGYHAAEMLDRRLKREIRTRQKRLLIPPAGIVARASTAGSLAEDVPLSKALGLIREHAAQEIHIDKIARLAGVSRRSLENRFKKTLGRSPHQELIRIRIEKAKVLLSGTSLPMDKIAELSGFGDPYNFSRAFRRETGSTPRQYRQQNSGTNAL